MVAAMPCVFSECKNIHFSLNDKKLRPFFVTVTATMTEPKDGPLTHLDAQPWVRLCMQA